MLTTELSAAERVQPNFIDPMLASPVGELPSGAAWSYEAKLDGYRCLAAKGSGATLCFGRGAGICSQRDFPRSPVLVRQCRLTR